ncbi:MAG: ribonuclease HIII [bacterium]|nr:ribonuclease HIII [bacterium]
MEDDKKLDITMFSGLPRIGCDESGKGDYFGGIVMAGVYLNEELEKQIEKFGVKDSKKISDKKIYEIALKLRRAVPHSIVAIYPEKYNELYSKMKNINSILSWGHSTVIKNILKKQACEIVIIDKFSVMDRFTGNFDNLEVIPEIFEFENGEKDTAVAAASILARHSFLEMIKRLSEEAGTELPLGSSHIIEKAREIVKEKGFDILSKIAKLHFKTTK